jgi:O-antigen/teichoic acid export membrane protein
MLLRALAQAALLVLLSRNLGAYSYGQFVAVIAVASLITPIAAAGLPSVLLRDGARYPKQVDAMLASARKTWLIVATTCAFSACLIAALLIHADLPWTSAGAAISAEILAASSSELIGRAEQARHRIGRYGAISAGLALLRLPLVAGYLINLGTNAELRSIFWLYALTGLAYTGALWLSGRPHPGQARLRVHEGIPFALAGLSTRLQGEFNKPILARVGFELVGNFNAAQRVVDMASLPLNALQEALWPRLYASSAARNRISLYVALLLSLAVLGGLLLWMAAPLIPGILGNGFSHVGSTLRWLCWLPAVQFIRNILNFSVIHSNRARIVGWAYFVGAMSSIILAWALIPRLATYGAIIAAYVTELVLITILALSCTGLRRNEASDET